MRGIGKACRRPPGSPLPVRPRDRNGGFPKSCARGLSGSVPHGSRCPASPRHALLAENLGKPSLWVITKDLWYNMGEDLVGDQDLPGPAKRKVAQTIAMTSAVHMRDAANSDAALTPPAVSALPY